MMLVGVLLVLLPWMLCARSLLALDLLVRMCVLGACVVDASGEHVYSDSDDEVWLRSRPQTTSPLTTCPPVFRPWARGRCAVLLES
jgi:hypothetical protein